MVRQEFGSWENGKGRRSWEGMKEVYGVSWHMTTTQFLLVRSGGLTSGQKLIRKPACADKLIRIFTPTGKLLHTIKGNLDVVRALCKIPRGHDSKADFASAGNDGIIRLWHLSGRQAGELIGHENFIYSLASLPNGDIVSSGEDRTLRIWRGSSCIQTITHPAISVWAVAVCSETGDIASGASDRILRVFTQSRDRYAEPETINAFEESVKSSSIPQQQVGDINKEKLPGPEFLVQKSGTKEGQVTMIKQPDGSVTAHQWSQSAQEWLNVGTVVDAVGSSGKKMDYLGKDYDYVFDVDIEEGKPPLKLPYNLSQNPFEAARKFIEDNELPMTYLDEVSNFITSNTQGATIGQTSQPPPVGSDPWGTESRYRPGDASSSSQAPPPPSAPKRARVLPQKEYLSIKTANLKMIEKKIVELSDQLKSEGQSDVALDAPATATLQTLMAELGRNQVSPSKGQDYVNLVTLMSVHWPAARRLPGLDLLRLLAAHSPAVAQYEDTTGRNAVELLESTGVFGDSERPNNTMLAVRVLANLFETEPGRSLMDSAFDQVQNILGTISTSSANRNLQVAIATLSINYTVFVTSDAQASAPQSMDRGISMMHGLTTMLSNATDPEEAYRCLVAAGTLLSLGEEVGTAANDIYDLGGVLKKVEKGFDEPRIKGMVMEISDLLK